MAQDLYALIDVEFNQPVEANQLEESKTIGELLDNLATDKRVIHTTLFPSKEGHVDRLEDILSSARKEQLDKMFWCIDPKLSQKNGKSLRIDIAYSNATGNAILADDSSIRRYLNLD